MSFSILKHFGHRKRERDAESSVRIFQKLQILCACMQPKRSRAWSRGPFILNVHVTFVSFVIRKGQKPFEVMLMVLHFYLFAYITMNFWLHRNTQLQHNYPAKRNIKLPESQKLCLSVRFLWKWVKTIQNPLVSFISKFGKSLHISHHDLYQNLLKQTKSLTRLNMLFTPTMPGRLVFLSNAEHSILQYSAILALLLSNADAKQC